MFNFPYSEYINNRCEGVEVRLCEIAPGTFICIWKLSRDLPMDLLKLIKLLWK